MTLGSSPHPVQPFLVPPAELQIWIGADPAIRLLDVRSASEFENAHIRGSYNVPIDLLSEHAGEIAAASDAQVVLVCQSGARARKGEAILRAAGMTNVHVLDGGMNAWLAAGQPAERHRARMSLERQVRIAAGTLVAVGSLLALTATPLAAILPLAVGSGLVIAGITDTCLMGMLLARLPYNRSATCDVPGMARALVDPVRTLPPGPARG
jgi:rhodanese-related sulfurtransferase